MLMYGFISIQAHLNTIGLSVGDLSRMLQRYITSFTLLLNSCFLSYKCEIFGYVCVFIWWWRESRLAIIKASWVQILLRGNWFSLSLFFIPCLHFFCETSCTFSSSLFFASDEHLTQLQSANFQLFILEVFIRNLLVKHLHPHDHFQSSIWIDYKPALI